MFLPGHGYGNLDHGGYTRNWIHFLPPWVCVLTVKLLLNHVISLTTIKVLVWIWHFLLMDYGKAMWCTTLIVWKIWILERKMNVYTQNRRAKRQAISRIWFWWGYPRSERLDYKGMVVDTSLKPFRMGWWMFGKFGVIRRSTWFDVLLCDKEIKFVLKHGLSISQLRLQHCCSQKCVIYAFRSHQ